MTDNQLMKIRLKLLLLVGFLCHCMIVPQLSAQSTAFTYQGRLNDGAAPANGLYDIKISLFDSPDPSADFFGSNISSAVSVSNGLFTVVLDFGVGPFRSPNFHLEIATRRTGETDFVTLTPRQHITPVPQAIHAETATSLVDGSVNSVNGLHGDVRLLPGQNVVIFTNGNEVFISVPTGGDGPWETAGTNIYYQHALVGIGTVFPDRVLTITGSGSGNEWLSFRVAGATRWHINNQSFGWNLVETGVADHRLFAAPGGNIGIGTPGPLAKLDVRGLIRFGANSEHSVVGAVETLHIIRGTVTSGGDWEGDGFTVIHSGTGDYNIVFNTPFLTRPTMTASVEFEFIANPGRMAMVDNVTATGGNVVVVAPFSNSGGTGLINGGFNFIAVGIR